MVKPTNLSGSCGVIRANNRSEFIDAFNRAQKIVRDISVNAPSGLLVEDYLPGKEIAIDALIHEGEVHVLAIFDKPDSLCGPYFPETIYLTLSGETDPSLREVKLVLANAVAALGLTRGSVHAEFRISPAGVFSLFFLKLLQVLQG